MKRYCLALDLKDDETLIEEYVAYHKKVWPEILQSIKEAGIEQMEIYLVGNRLFMMMEANDSFNFEKKRKADAANKKVQEWETLMWKYQQAIPGCKPGEKWVLMEKIFEASTLAESSGQPQSDRVIPVRSGTGGPLQRRGNREIKAKIDTKKKV